MHEATRRCVIMDLASKPVRWLRLLIVQLVLSSVHPRGSHDHSWTEGKGHDPQEGK